MKNVNLHMILLIICCSILSSCSTYYWCNVSAFGNTPKELTYHVEPDDSTLVDDLEYQEYAAQLKMRLNEVGYIESPASSATLCIVLSYYIGEEKYVGASTFASTNNVNFTNGKINSNTQVSGTGKVTTSAKNSSVDTKVKTNTTSSTTVQIKQKNQGYTFSNSSTQAQYETPIGCKITALDNQDMKPIWSVEVTDKLTQYSYSFRSYMPWMIYAAQSYFGKSGESRIEIKRAEGEAKGLKWFY